MPRPCRATSRRRCASPTCACGQGGRGVRARSLVCCLVLLTAAGAARAEEPAAPPGDKHMSGMSVVGNDDAPKALVIVPWKSSLLGHTLDVSRGLDDGRQPVDRDVFARALDSFEIRAAAYDGASWGECY